MKLEFAEKIAIRCLEQLRPYTNEIMIAGSIRRKRPEVKDIEIVCLPKVDEIKDMFGNIVSSQYLEVFGLTVRNLGVLEIGNPRTSKYCRIILPEGIKLDLFMPIPADYIRQVVIRTGPADFAKRVAIVWRAAGWVGTENGLRLEKECQKVPLSNEKHKWNCIVAEPTLPPIWTSEEDFFDFLDKGYTKPEDRF